MKNLRSITYLGLGILAGLGVALAATNPSQSAYQEYATQRLTAYLETKDICAKVPRILQNILHRNCSTLLDLSQPAVQQAISQGTQQQNFIFFSIYSTDLTVTPLLPSYHFATVGVFQNFFTYSAEKR
ncbi:MAG: DUF4359 domain-containing protein [Chroococcidiopsidaceae cyanobacterium CP_BM_RX_35]|nr:DUF4359 domain-containing protein [Chroococcidiopsidaceae cyanobacterium CP_BM_RX_35]